MSALELHMRESARVIAAHYDVGACTIVGDREKGDALRRYRRLCVVADLAHHFDDARIDCSADRNRNVLMTETFDVCSLRNGSTHNRLRRATVRSTHDVEIDSRGYRAR